MGLDYSKLTFAEFGSIELEKKNPIIYPGNEIVEWYGFRRHNFELDGCKGFIVEPPNPAPGLPWSWCTQWAEAFVPRTPALKLLERGFHHVHLDVFATRMNPEGIKKVEKFYALLQSMKFHPKAALIGMSYGGLFSLRWAQEHPETVGVIYLDAPVTDLAFANRSADNGITKDSLVNAAAYGVAPEELSSHPLSPNNNCQAIADAKIPIICLRSGQDQTVFPQSNSDLFAERLTAAGGKIQIVNRALNGHHPHGLDDPTALVNFILNYYPESDL
ncbi:MAG: alpha/beta hydrolase [Lentisphaerae bacterium]|nr:alpha/beta hydrolase [Lentisphaerota bacterium]